MNKNLFAVLAVLCLTVAGVVLPQRVAAQQQTQDVVFGPVSTYHHKSGWFSLARPGNWNVTDNSGAGEVIVSIIDPTENGVVVVRVYQPSRGYTQAELGEMLKGFLRERMGTFDAFTMGDSKSQKDGSLGLCFKYNSVVAGVSYKMYGDAFIEQHNGLIGLITLIMPQDQYDAKQKDAYAIVNSFRVTGTGP
jgi:C1A family cysteine protease